MNQTLVVKGLVKHFQKDAGLFARATGKIHAVNDISFSIGQGQTLGIVGESGSGKTTTARLLLRIHEPDAGSMFLGNSERDFFKLDAQTLKRERLRLQYIFQDPHGSLNPKLQVRRLVTEPLEAARRLAKQRLSATERDRVAVELCERVGLQASDISRYAHEFSGGQRQRLAIARALSVKPELIICDEPVSSLDVSIQSQILNLLNDLQRQDGVSYLFIGHNLPVVFYVSDEVAVMYAGRIVEQAPTRLLSERQLHPYSKELRLAGQQSATDRTAAAPSQQPAVPLTQTPACAYYQRCPLRTGRCLVETPQLLDKGQGHLVACHAV